MPESRRKTALRWLLAVIMVAAGIAHFLITDQYTAIVPSWLPAPRMLVLVSGVCEIAGGLGLLVPPVRRAAAWGLVLLFLAVFPANINQAIHNIQPYGQHLPNALLWVRLPLQALLIAWAWSYTRKNN